MGIATLNVSVTDIVDVTETDNYDNDNDKYNDNDSYVVDRKVSLYIIT